MNSLDVITFGEAMAMFMAEQPGPLHEIKHYTKELAGAETNVAIGLARLGLRAGWVSKVGNDPFGTFIMKRLQEEYVNTDCVLVDSEHATGFQIKSKVEVGDPEVCYFRKNSAASHLHSSDFNQTYFLAAKHMHMTGIPLAVSASMRDFALHALRSMKAAGRTVSFDPNLRPTLWKSQEEMVVTINEAAKQANYVLPGIEEGKILTGYENPEDIASYYLDAGVELVVIKLGEQGAFFKTAKEQGMVEGIKVKQIVDTVGAGDGFAVGLLSGLLQNDSLTQSVRRANAIGALAVQSPGDNDGYPTEQQLQRYMESQKQGVK
ncbi:sugar kinase [Priestia megaterium]|uniref:Kinase, pfkB family n=1 Tax=Priestia megaterium (strain DSM 319 / IMG 1521) TaxID=592022 RepID=D5DHX7_PRIM3|nr:sugar kinase [Priestia megaterium]ADF39815.1 kinase, pfkB family [Priestia megaterium DSM 319]MED4214592.1 sugar kinase [Priestia megaterium]WEZ38947.1 sugar kinase [Priestia megaterium DSM 319]